LATEEDKAAERDKWAELFRAKTWEELKMAAAQNAYMDAAAQKLYDANSDYIARERARTLEDNLRKERRWQRLQEQFEEQTVAMAEKDATIAEQADTIAALRAEINRLRQPE